jgi:hypothetical protein
MADVRQYSTKQVVESLDEMRREWQRGDRTARLVAYVSLAVAVLSLLVAALK